MVYFFFRVLLPQRWHFLSLPKTVLAYGFCSKGRKAFNCTKLLDQCVLSSGLIQWSHPELRSRFHFKILIDSSLFHENCTFFCLVWKINTRIQHNHICHLKLSISNCGEESAITIPDIMCFKQYLRSRVVCNTCLSFHVTWDGLVILLECEVFGFWVFWVSFW